MCIATVVIHVSGLVFLVSWLRWWYAEDIEKKKQSPIAAIQALVYLVLWVFVLHTTEIWLWAHLYLQLDQFDNLQTALYFSTITFTTLGYGDITLAQQWQLLSGLESANGSILLGVSTAFIFAVLIRFFFDG